MRCYRRLPFCGLFCDLSALVTGTRIQEGKYLGISDDGCIYGQVESKSATVSGYKLRAVRMFKQQHVDSFVLLVVFVCAVEVVWRSLSMLDSDCQFL